MRMTTFLIVTMLIAAIAFGVKAQAGKGLLDKAKNKVKSATGNDTENSSATVDPNAAKSEIHKKYIDKIVFSKKPIIIGQENEADFTNKFTAADKIYGMVYLKAGINDLNGGQAPDEVYLYVSIDGSQQAMTVNKKLEEYEKKANLTYWAFEIIADPANSTSNMSMQFVYNHFREMSKRKHKIKLDMNKWNSGGEFELDWTNADLPKLEAEADKAEEMAEVNVAKFRQLPAALLQPSHVCSDKELQEAALKKSIGMVLLNLAEIQKIHVQPSATGEWKIEKNELDVPVRKISACPITVVYKDTNGDCYYAYVTMEKQYEGGGVYGPANAITGPQWTTRISCANVKK